MILKGSQRGGAARLAAHLMNTHDNDHIEVHEVSGFMSDTLEDALKETDAIAQGTRCKQFLFSVSLDPPENVDTATFNDAINRMEEKLNLKGQPRVIVFHEKEGRRHAHCVWSRIDTQNMRAINMPFYKTKMMELSKQLFLENNWKLPQGFINREQRNPLNFTRDEWRQAKRLDENPKMTKATLKECWLISDNKQSFQKALEQHGYYLAKGDRRGYVAVDWRGEIYSLSRATSENAKALKEKLGNANDLPSVQDTRDTLDQALAKQIQNILNNVKREYKTRLGPLMAQKKNLKKRHNQERETLKSRQEQRWQQETQQRQARLKKGMRGLLQRFTGKQSKIIEQNEHEAYNALIRDRQQKDDLINGQLDERQTLQKGISHTREQQEKEVQEIKHNLFSSLSKDKSFSLQSVIEASQSEQDQNKQHRSGPSLSM